MKYWCNEEEKQKLLIKYTKNYERIERELREKYNPNNLFKNV